VIKPRLRKAATSLLLIVVVALAARVVFAWSQARRIPGQALSLIPFQTETGHIAYSIAGGKGYSSPFQRDTGPTAWLAPVYPYLLAAIFKLFGIYTLRSFYAALSLNILFSCVACVPIFFAGKRISGIGVAAAAAWLWALFPNAFIIPFEWIWDTSLSALLVATLLWATLELAESGRLSNWALYGLLWGFALLTNPAVALLFPVLIIWAAVRRRGAPAPFWFARPAVAATVALLCCAPWTIRNYIVFHKLIPLRSNLPFELYIGNNENYDDQHRGHPAAITQDREIVRYLHMGETAFMEEEKRKALDFIYAHPRIELWLISQRFVDFWMGTVTPVEAWRQADSFWIRAILLCNFVAPFGALLGVAILIVSKNPSAIPVISFPIIFPLLYYVTHTSLRYRHPLDPIVLLLTAIGVHGIWSSLSRSRRGAIGSRGPSIQMKVPVLPGQLHRNSK
jgi:hypothetical protein